MTKDCPLFKDVVDCGKCLLCNFDEGVDLHLLTSKMIFSGMGLIDVEEDEDESL